MRSFFWRLLKMKKWPLVFCVWCLVFGREEISDDDDNDDDAMTGEIWEESAK